jgi:RimJ/RimL family protein N-acetyltransferase
MATAKLHLPEKLSDGTVTLRPVRGSDVPDIVAVVQDPEIPRFTMIPSPYGEDNARNFIRRSAEATVAGVEADFAIVDEDDRLVGMTGIRIDREHQIGDIGYWCAKEARGRGLVTGALRLVSRWAFEELGLARLEVTVHEDNPASQRVAEKAGYTREGVMRAYREQRGKRVDLIMFSLLPEDLA